MQEATNSLNKWKEEETRFSNPDPLYLNLKTEVYESEQNMLNASALLKVASALLNHAQQRKIQLTLAQAKQASVEENFRLKKVNLNFLRKA